MKKNNKKGFTLVELVIVVAVMAILVAVAIPTVASITGKATTAVNDSNAQTIESILKLEMAETNAQTLTSDTVIAQAIVDAQLGINKASTFVFNTKSGEVKSAAAVTDATNEKLITFSTSGVKVGAMTTETPFTSVSATQATTG